MKTRIWIFCTLLMLTSNVISKTTGSISGNIYDDNHKPLLGANILLEGTNIGTASDIHGMFKLVDIPVGSYNLLVKYIGYKNYQAPILVKTNQTTILDSIILIYQVLKGESVVITAQRSGQMAAINQDFSTAESIARLPGVSIYRNQVSSKTKEFNTEEYDYVKERGFLKTIDEPLSTFSIDVDVASYANTRRYLNQDKFPLKDAVRIEEFINYFNYEYSKPIKDDPFSINMEYSECPWNSDNKLVHIGLKGKTLEPKDIKSSNLVFLIDVSGSMQANNKLPLLQKSFNLLIDKLSENDHVAIVVYAGAAGVVLPSTAGSQKEIIKQKINELRAGGSTAGGEGIRLAYKIAKENFIKEGNNRIILATDGDFNIGISSTSELERLIETKRNEGIFLTILGFGMGNYKDNRMETLADKGNGNYAYIDNLMEAQKVLVNDIQATLFTIAKDVKIQVEFNPALIKSYRLIGYENRMLNKEDFEDDTKDAGEIGAGHTVTALYEIEISEFTKRTSTIEELKYSHRSIKPSALKSKEILTLNVRYKEPSRDKSKLIQQVLKNNPKALKETSNNYQFSAAVAEFAMILRDSEYKANASLDHVLESAKNALGKDAYGYRHEFLQLVKKTKIIQQLEQ